MKKIFFLLTVFAFVFLTGCFSFFSYIEVNNKSADVTFKFTISKAILDMTKSYGKNGNNEFQGMDASNFPKELHATSTKINSDSEEGFLIKYTVPKDIEYKNSFAIPYLTDNSITITLENRDKKDDKKDDKKNTTDASMEKYTDAFLSMAKFTILIKINTGKKISSAKQITGEETNQIAVDKLSDGLYLLEVSLLNWYKDSEITKIRIDLK